MSIYKKIANNFECDEPIFIEDIEAMFPDRSRPWIDKTIKTMVDLDMIKRFSTGVYYIPRKTIFGDSLLNPQKVILKKYIKKGDNFCGYMSGTALLNSLGLTTQVPNTLTIVSNNESSRGRKVNVGNQAYYIMKSNAKVTNENRAVLQLLETFKLIDINELDEFERYNLEKYIEENNITLEKISKYCSYFPDFVSRRLLGGNLIEKIARQ